MKNKIIQFVYSTLFLPLAVIRILFKSYRNPKYLERLSERFALFDKFDIEIDLWIHTVSVGEFLAAKVLVDALIKIEPNIKLLITTTTPTGSQLVQDYIAKNQAINIKHVYYPYDATFICKKFLNKTNPKQVIYFETEIWPKMFGELDRRNIKLSIVNARLSEKSYNGYSNIRELIANTLNKIDFIAAQGESDKQRFIDLGYNENNIKVFGNIKYNLRLPEDISSAAKFYKSIFGQDRKVIIAASTHLGEEEIMLSVFSKLKKQFPELLLIIAPRHPERFDTIYSMCLNSSYRVTKFTELDPTAVSYKNTEILLLNTLGRLLYFYNIADLAIIGGSFVDIGGHNPIEPATLSVPSIIGPYYYNFNEVVTELEANKGIIVANTVSSLETAAENLLNNKGLSGKIGAAGFNTVAQHQDILKKYIKLIMGKSVKMTVAERDALHAKEAKTSEVASIVD